MSPGERMICKAPVLFLWKAGKNGTWLSPRNWKEGIINLTSERLIIAERHLWHVIFHDQILRLGEYHNFSPLEGDATDPVVFSDGMDYYLTLIQLSPALRDRFLAQTALTIIMSSRRLKVSERGERSPARLELDSGGVRLYAERGGAVKHLGIIETTRPLQRHPDKWVVRARDEGGERYFLMIGPRAHLSLLKNAVKWASVNPLTNLSELHLSILRELNRNAKTTERLSQILEKNSLEISRAIYDLVFLGLIEMTSTKCHYRLSRKGVLALELIRSP